MDIWQQLARDISALGKKAQASIKTVNPDGSKTYQPPEYYRTPRQLKDPHNFVTELVQVAALAIATIEDYGGQVEDIYKAIQAERSRQDTRFGKIRGQDYLVWAACLMEELGEVVDEVQIDEEPNTQKVGLVPAFEGAEGSQRQADFKKVSDKRDQFDYQCYMQLRALTELLSGLAFDEETQELLDNANLLIAEREATSDLLTRIISGQTYDISITD